MQKKKCPILELIGLVAAAAAVVAAAVVVLPKVIAFVKDRFAKDEIDGMEFEFEEEPVFEEESEFVRPEPMETEAAKEEPETNTKDDIFEEE